MGRLSDSMLSPASRLLDFVTMATVHGDGRSSRALSASDLEQDPDRFALLLRRFRIRLSVSRSELARRVGVSQSAVKRWEMLEALPEAATFQRTVECLRLTQSERASIASSWAYAKSCLRRSPLISICRRGVPSPRKGKGVATADDRRRQTRRRVERLRARRWLESRGLREGSGELAEAVAVLSVSRDAAVVRYGEKTVLAMERVR